MKEKEGRNYWGGREGLSRNELGKVRRRFEEMKSMQRMILGQHLWKWATVRPRKEGSVKWNLFFHKGNSRKSDFLLWYEAFCPRKDCLSATVIVSNLTSIPPTVSLEVPVKYFLCSPYPYLSSEKGLAMQINWCSGFSRPLSVRRVFQGPKLKYY